MRPDGIRQGVARRGGVLPVVAGVALGVAAGLYGTYSAVLYTRQRAILFPAKPNPRAPDSLTRWLETPRAKVEIRWFPAEGDSSGTAALFFHGNKEIVDHWPLSVSAWTRRGVGVLLVEYPGYGNSSGAGPTQETIREASEAAWDWLVGQPGVDPRRTFAAGRSLGGGVACDLARTRPVAGLFLQSTFASVRGTATARYKVPGFLVRDPFDNAEVLRGFEGPILAMHGTEDRTIPFENLDQLRRAAPGGRYVVFPGHGHSTLPGPDSTLYWSVIDSFLAQVRAR